VWRQAWWGSIEINFRLFAARGVTWLKLDLTSVNLNTVDKEFLMIKEIIVMCCYGVKQK
jgi:hypothetical protein